MDNPITHPKHYTSGKIEVMDFIEDQKLNFALGNVVKYVCRHKLKNGLEDLKKAAWYLDREIKSMEFKEPDKMYKKTKKGLLQYAKDNETKIIENITQTHSFHSCVETIEDFFRVEEDK